jgi:hypothetical protein
LEYLLRKLYQNEVSAAIVEEIKHHADILGPAICGAYTTLHDIVIRHESTIRKRWAKKSVAQRREVLLAAWPDMPRKYRPDDCFNLMPYSKLYQKQAVIGMLTDNLSQSRESDETKTITHVSQCTRSPLTLDIRRNRG